MSGALVGALLGGVTGLGLFAVGLGVRGVEVRPRGVRASVDQHRVVRAAVAVVVGVVVVAGTGWLVGGVFAAGTVVLAPRVLGARRRHGDRLARLTGLAAWAEGLRDLFQAGAGLESALRESARVAPEAIASEVRELATAAERGVLLPALLVFADAVDDPAGDLVVSALLLAVRRQGAGLGSVLGAAAAAARSQVAMRERIEATRARTYTSARIVVGVTLGFAALMVVANRSYLAPFDGAAGQVALAGVGACFAAGLLGVVRLATPPPPIRLLGTARGDTGAVTDGGGPW